MVTTCLFSGCKKRASYSMRNSSPQYCLTHKTSEMVIVTHKQCAFMDCKIIAVYNFKGAGSGKFCVAHKLEGMIDVKNYRCTYNACLKQACYGFTKGISLRCSTHRENGMINVRKKKCIHLGCEISAGYNYPDIKGNIYCSLHKLDGMTSKKNYSSSTNKQKLFGEMLIIDARHYF